MDHDTRKQGSAVHLPYLGWLLLSEEERRLLKAYVELALTHQRKEETYKQDKLNGKATHKHRAEAYVPLHS